MSHLPRRALLALPALLPFGAARAQARPVAVASFSILADLMREVAGERAEVRAMAGADVDAHHFSPRPSDLVALRGARLAAWNGAGFDPWFERALGSTRFAGVRVVATRGIHLLEEHGHGRGHAPSHGHGHGHGHAHAHGRAHGHSHGGPDPHVWQSPLLALRMAENAKAGLIEADRAGEAHFNARAGALAARLRELDAWIRTQVATVPEARRVVLTSHHAFAYFGEAYGVRFLAPQGMGHGEPSARQVGELIRQVRAQNVTAVFLENVSNPATLRRLAEEAGVRVQGRLYSDALSGPEGPAATYEAMMRHNVTLMVRAMLG